MAKEKRDYVWLVCSVCGAKNYRTERRMNDSNKLKLNKFCPEEQKHTLHEESRKK